ncbi:LytR C-terminal domain-containing protein [Corynebacterium tapiri]|uniref:LytR family transcriptional regulator n=1 Tax=Corynebacterium tapiri TaxID=1448266 RepID=A0A5C4U333_9CORY|nr:LytR C-terminal domain-containing protein [Corynebacterium tapiri]TNL95757.1 LytR family transcriptional regulator [Corynebacterium tapiri]
MTNVNPENDHGRTEGSHAVKRGGAAAAGLPLRGLAMVLIAVFILLGLWGLYALTQKGDDSNQAASSNSTTAISSSAPQNEAAPSSGQRVPPATAPASPSASAPAAAPAAPGQPAPAPGAETGAAAGAGAGSAAAQPTVNVLNNSTVGGLAERVFNDLKAQGTHVGNHGNLPGDSVRLPETTVFYQPGDAAGEKAARDLADRIAKTNGVPATAKPNDAALPKDVVKPGDITLALIGDIHI